ncbi:hypothetical protein ACFODT_08600 [Vibrio zhugei]|uniref:Uncharacterized protein n=1 Tax=Vibrio zhugei TaxID=2479546 RepID=A0ABV7CAK2_9VIBR
MTHEVVIKFDGAIRMWLKGVFDEGCLLDGNIAAMFEQHYSYK